VPIGTAVHERTFPLCQSLNYREWSGFYAVSVYETHHEHEYNAIRNAAALIDVTPLYKYIVTGRDATRFVNRIIAKLAIGREIRRNRIPHWYMYFCGPIHGKLSRILLAALYNAIRGILFATPKDWRTVL